ncbi:MAG TPA: hypothetical protein VEU47_11030 [Candidatus Cybelea sp.]|nr:hypothetical protein [Candidatus Cybelea sp.]
MSDHAMHRARIEAVDEVARALLTASGEALQRHGDDPFTDVILGAAVAMFVEKVEKIIPGFAPKLIKLLEKIE